MLPPHHHYYQRHHSGVLSAAITILHLMQTLALDMDVVFASKAQDLGFTETLLHFFVDFAVYGRIFLS